MTHDRVQLARRAMLNRLARDATGMKLIPTTRHRGFVSHVICVHVCMCVYVSVAQPSPPLEESAGHEALLPT